MKNVKQYANVNIWEYYISDNYKYGDTWYATAGLEVEWRWMEAVCPTPLTLTVTP